VLTYNRRGYLEKLIQSIKDSKVLEMGQVELVVIDNGSTDNTRQFLSSLPADTSIRIVHREFNLRGSIAYKELVGIATGQWVISPGDDDVFDSKTLNELPEKLRTLHKEITLVPFSARTIDKDGNRTPVVYRPSKEINRSVLFADLFEKSIYWLPATCFRRSLVTEFEIPKTITVFDWWIWLQGISHGRPEPQESTLIDYRVHSGQEQRTYLSDAWQLDQMDVFTELIEENVLHEWINKATELELTQFIQRLMNSQNERSSSISSKFLYLKLCKKIAFTRPLFSEMIINLLIKKGFDVRFIAQLFGRDLSTDYLKSALVNLGLDWTSLENTADQKDLESLLYERLLSLRRSEIEKDITPTEKRVLGFYRKIRGMNLIRWIIKK